MTTQLISKCCGADQTGETTSECCGAADRDAGYGDGPSYSDVGLCSDCKDHCEYTERCGECGDETEWITQLEQRQMKVNALLANERLFAPTAEDVAGVVGLVLIMIAIVGLAGLFEGMAR